MRSEEAEELQAEAVSLGYAEYQVIDEFGNTEFIWKTKDNE
jgi:hypothetical protein